MPQGATFIPFSVPIPAISHFLVLDFSPETRENLWKIFKISKTEFLFCRKEVVSSA